MKQILIFVLLLFFTETVFPCTIYKLTVGDRTIVGNNEDFFDPDTWMWTEKSALDRYGVVYFGFGDFTPQGAINEKGLVFDAFATPRHMVHRTNSGNFISGYPALIRTIMSTCSNAAQARQVLENHFLEGNIEFQIMFIDRNGDSFIYEGDDIVPSPGAYQICENFLQSRSLNSPPAGAVRYRTVETMLKSNPEASVERALKILHAVHRDTAWGGTQYSQVYELDNLTFHLFLFHDFEHPRDFSVATLLKKGDRKYRMKDLFGRNEKYEDYLAESKRIRNLCAKIPTAKNRKQLDSLLSEIGKTETFLLFLDKLLLTADNFVILHKLDYALDVLKTCATMPSGMPGKAKILMKLAIAASKSGDIKGAMDAVDQAIALAPDDSEPRQFRKVLQELK